MFILWYLLRCHRQNGNVRRGFQIHSCKKKFNRSVQQIWNSYSQKSKVNQIDNHIDQNVFLLNHLFIVLASYTIQHLFFAAMNQSQEHLSMQIKSPKIIRVKITPYEVWDTSKNLVKSKFKICIRCITSILNYLIMT